MLSTTILLLALSGSVEAPPPEHCTVDGVWSYPRQLLERRKAEPEYRPLTAADPELIRAIERYVAAHREGDVSQLEKLTLKLPLHLAKQHREWIAESVGESTWHDLRPVLLWLDDSNPLHVMVYFEVALEVEDRCLVDAMMSRWVLLDGKWRLLPGGAFLS